MYKNQQNTVFWCNLKLAQRKGLQFYQTRSHAIALFNTLPAMCIEKVVYMKTGEDLYCKVYQSPRLPRAVFTPNLPGSIQPRSKNILRPSKRTMREVRGNSSLEETRRGNVDYRIQGKPHSTLQKEDSNRKEIVKRLIQQFETHPNRDSLMEDLNKTEEFNPSSEKVEGVDHQHGVTRSTSSCARSFPKIQCPDCSKNWEVGNMHAAVGKETTVEQS